MRKIPINEWEGIEYQVVDGAFACDGCIGNPISCYSLSDKINCIDEINNNVAKRHVTIAEYKTYKEGLNESI